MYLDELFKNTPHIEIKQLSIDSRMPMNNCIFFCIAGIKDDGHDYVNEAIKNGANVIVYSDDIDTKGNAIFIKVNNTIDCLNSIAPKFYNEPSKKLDTYLTSGCDGVSLVSYLLTKLIKNFKSVASIGVNGIFYGENHLMSNVPTLTIIDTQRYLKNFVDDNIKAVTLEADCLALYYKKLDSLKPNVFIYTSTNEYSSNYQEMDSNYYDVMCNYLYTLDDNTLVILNRDDNGYDELIKAAGENTYTYGVSKDADYLISNIKLKANSSKFDLTYNNETYEINTKLIGIRNVYATVATLCALHQTGYDLNEVVLLLPFIEPLKGEMQPIDLDQDFKVYVDKYDDYNSLKETLEFSKSILPKNKKLVALFGIGYNDEDDTIKEMADLSKQYVNKVILTEGDTYSGNVTTILNDAKDFFIKQNPLIIEDREVAINCALDLLNSDDILLILGKGKEKYIYRNLGRETYKGDEEVAKEGIKEILEESSNFTYEDY